MTRHLLLATAAAAATLIFSEPGFAAGPPAGVTMGPPAGVTMGPPAGVTMGPPAGVTMGPPASVTMGPPAAAMSHIPDGVQLGQPAGVSNMGTNASSGDTIGGTVSASASSHAQDQSYLATNDTATADAANVLGNLNAAHASSTALQHASSNSIVGEIATYKSAMTSANQDYSSGNIDYATYQSDVSTAQTNLADASNKDLTPDAISKINNLLDIVVAPAP